MQSNIFMISDASYSDKTKVAGVAVIDTNENKKYSTVYKNIDSPTLAEFYALVFSMKVALENHYDNVVFVYDCLAIDTKPLKKYAMGKFSSVQFLWLKRKFVKEADYLAVQSRKLAEKLNINQQQISKEEKKLASQKIKDKELIRIFKSFSEYQILNACIYHANPREKEILESYINGRTIEIYGKNGAIIGLGSKKKKFIKFVYLMLPEDARDKFFKYLQYIDPRIQKKDFNEHCLSNLARRNLIDNILQKMKNKIGQ